MNRTHRLIFAALPLALAAAAAAQHTPDGAERALLDGNRRFLAGDSARDRNGPGHRRTLARGASPFAVVVTCADSVAPPELVFDARLGDLVVVRTAGHVLGAEAIATIEHAVRELNVPLCIVLAHQGCDVIAAAADAGRAPSPAVARLLERIEPAVRAARALELGGAELLRKAEEEHAQATALACLRQSGLLRSATASGRLRVKAARYHASGEVELLPQRALPAEAPADKPVLRGEAKPGLPPHVALRLLRAGHRRFLSERRARPDLSERHRAALAAAQQPLAIVVTDSDARVSPEILFDAGLGELFVVRLAGHVMTDEALASVEFAASRLGASLLVVMGHSHDAALAAAAAHPTKASTTRHQRALLRSLEPAHQGGNVDHHGASAENVRRALAEARARSKVLQALEREGKFTMLGGYYDVATGDLEWLPHEPTAATVAAAEEHAPATAEQHGAHASGDEHADHDGHDHEHDSHAPSAASSEHGHDAHADLPTLDLPAPLGETAPQATSHAHGHGHGSHGHGLGHAEGHQETDAHEHDAHHGEHASDDGHGEQHHDDDHGGHDAAHAHEATHGDKDAHGHSHEHGHSDHSTWTNPVVLGGLGGMSALLAAAWLATRRRS